MNGLIIAFLMLLIAFVVTTMVYPPVLSFAIKNNIVDNPNARKLQRVPVPVMGGTVVMIGILVASIAFKIIAPEVKLLWPLVLMFVMYALGVWDDRKNISAFLRFVIEIAVVWAMIASMHIEVDDFHGLWGLSTIPTAISIPLSIISGVGIINSINLIDGVDGYCSSYGMITCSCFAVLFWYEGDMPMFTMALIFIGALFPFFLHNVFGRSSKMFLGDGGSLMLGTVIAMFVFKSVSSGSNTTLIDASGLSLIAVSFAILSVPVFDTLRVMTARISNGLSPFHPDKTHLHHLFIEMDFSHLATSLLIVFGNLLIGLIGLAVWKLGASVDVQVYVVIGLALLFTTVFYYVMQNERRKNDGAGSPLFMFFCKRGRKTHFTTTKFWQFIRSVVDSRILAGNVQVEHSIQNDSEQEHVKLDPRIR